MVKRPQFPHRANQNLVENHVTELPVGLAFDGEFSGLNAEVDRRITFPVHILHENRAIRRDVRV